MDVRHYAFLARQPSAAVKTREHFCGMPKRGLAFLLVNVMFWQPLWAQADGIVVATPGTSLGQAGNGVPIIQIATPNGTGLSHNQFHDYNVGTQGVILNNVAHQTGATQLGGIIIGNPNLTNGIAAQTILNEVVGGSPSQLRGYTEVAGQSARVIVANPYGITCNGCGFINTPRVTLTTGKPVLDGSGRLDRFQVDQGSIAIERAGLNASNIDRFEIITRSAKINAEIQANNLTIVAGRNDVNAQTLDATARANDGSTKPGLAIDSSALGGMYAGAIKLVGTEAGIGVKLAGNLAASGGDIQIDANGHLSLAQASAAGAVNVNVASLETQGPVYAGSRLNVNTVGDLNNSQNLAARNSISLSAGGQLTNSGNIEAGINADNSRNSSGDVSLTAKSLINNANVVASRQLTTRVQTLNNSGGNLNGAAGVAVTASGAMLNQNGQLSSTGAVNLVADSLNNTSGQLVSNQTLTLAANQITNQTGLISGWQGLNVTGGSLDNRNTGTLSSRSGDVAVTLSGTLINSQAGAVVSQQALHVNAASVDNRNGILSSAGGQTLSVAGLLDNSANGLLDSGALLTLQAMTLSNAGGKVNGLQAMSINVTDLDNSSGSMAANGAITLDLLGTLTNTGGTLSSGSDLLLKRAVQVNNQGGKIASQTLLTLLTGGLDNSHGGTVGANDTLTITAGGALQNGSSGLIDSRNGDLVVQADSLDNSTGSLQSHSALNLIINQAISNVEGKILAQQGDLDITAGAVDSRGGVLTSLQGAFTSHVTGVLKNGYDLNGKGGVIQAQNLDLHALAGLDNNGGHISAQSGDALINAQNIDNRDGVLFAKNVANVTGVNFDNSGSTGGKISGERIELNLNGALNNTLGIIESTRDLAVSAVSLNNQNGQMRALGNTGLTQLNIRDLLDNRNGTLETANTDLSISAGNFLNAGGSVLHLGTGSFGLSMANIAGAGGRLVTHSDLTLNADSWTNTGVLQANRLTVNVRNFTQTANGQLLASDSFNGSGVNWLNDGLLASSGNFALSLDGAYSGNGRMSSVGSLGLSAAQIDTTSAASITAGTIGSVSSTGSLTNLGRLTSAGALTVNAAYLNNQGTLGSGENLRVNATSLINENGLIFSGGDMALRVNDFTNRYADVYSLGNISIAKDDNNGLSTSISNVSASLESVGDLSLAADYIENRKDVFQVVGKLVSAKIGVQCYSCSSYDPLASVGSDSYAVWVENYQSRIVQDSASATMTAGRNFMARGGELLNQASTLSAGNDLTLNLQNFTNRGASVGDYSVRRSIALSAGQQSADFGLWVSIMDYNAANDPSYDPGSLGYVGGSDPTFSRPNIHFWNSSGAESVIQVAPRPGGKNLDSYTRFGSVHITVSAGSLWYNFALPHYSDGVRAAAPGAIQYATPFENIVTYTSPSSYAHAVVQGGGTVNINAAQNLTNSVVREGVDIGTNASRVGSTQLSGQPAPTIINLNAQLPPDLAQQQINPLTLPGFILPTGQNGLFRLSSAASSIGISQAGALSSSAAARPHKYLIETNPVLTNLKSFMSSDYLLANLGYDPDQSAKRLGDGLYEQRLIQQAVIARTGQRYIDGQTSDEGLFKYLMNNAVASKDALNLSMGVSLTSQQVAALTHDIVWLEEHEVNGEKVLVPVLYLAQVEGRLGPTGALVAGKDVSLIAGQNLDNVGTLRATNNLSATAGKNVVNSGLIEAGNRLDALANNDVVNKAGGIIAGRDVSVTAITGDVVNERTLTTLDSAARGITHKEFANTAARIEATNDLNVSAGRDINNLGGALQSGRDMSLEAARDVNLAAQQVSNSSYQSANHNSSDTTQLGATVSVGRDLSVEAGRDVNVIASDVEAKRDIAMDAGENLTISSAADEEHSLKKSKKVTRQEDHVSQVMSGVTAGGDVALSAGQNLAVISSRITAGDEAYLVAGDRLDILAAQDTDYSLYDMKKKGSFGSLKTRHDEVTKNTYIGSEITTGGNLTLSSGGDQRYQVAKLDSGKDIVIDSGGSILFEGVKDLHDESHTKSNNDAFWTSSKGKGNTDETFRQTQMIAKGSITIKAVDGLKIDLKQVDQQTVTQAIDAMVQADPQLAWLKQAEARGDVDWRLVKEIHESFKYENSGLGPASQIIIAIVMAAIVGPAALSALSASMGTAWAAGLAAVASGAATNATTSFINNGGNLGAVFQDVTSSEALKGYVISGVTAGVTAGVFDGIVKTTTTPTGKVIADLSNLEGIGRFGANQVLQGGTSALLGKALGQEGSVSDVLKTALFNTLAAASFNAVGQYTKGVFDDGSVQKIAIHAIVGGLLAQVTGGDFKTGAMAAGANEALIGYLDNLVKGDENLLTMSSQIVGVLAATAQKDVDASKLEKAAWVAKNASQYNRQLHKEDKEIAAQLAARSGGKYTAEQIEEQLRLSGVKGTDIQAGNIVATKDGIYDTSAKWLDLGNGQYVQQLAKLDLELVAYIQSSNSNYTWAAFPVAPDYDWSKTPNVSDEVRDRLSGRVLDAQGGFRTPVLVDGEAFNPRFWPCGDASCVAIGTGLDLKDPETQRWISAGNAKAAKEALAVGALVPVPMAWIGKVLGSVFGRGVAGEALVGGSLGAGAKATGGAAGKVDDLATSGLSSASNLPSGTGLGGFKVGLSADDITAINSQFGGSVSFREVDTAIANAANYDGFYNKAGSMIRDIAGGHLFDNGNKRTAVEVVEQLIIKNGVDGPPKQIIWNVVDKVATGKLTNVQDISKALRGLD